MKKKKLVPFLSSTNTAIEKMLDMTEASEDDILYDVGSGIGDIIKRSLQEPYNVKYSVGIELDPSLAQRSIQDTLKLKNKIPDVENRFKILNEDFLTSNLEEATIVTLYLFDDVNELIRPKLEEQLNKNARVVSNMFPVPNWKPSKIEEINSEFEDFLLSSNL